MKGTLIHASCIALEGKGVILLGPSGSGKSDLALRLIESGAQLVADDQVMVEAENGVLMASAPEKIQGMIEARGVGILRLPFAASVPLALAVQLAERTKVERFPEPQFFSCLGLQLPLLSLHAFDDSTTAKIRFALAREV